MDSTRKLTPETLLTLESVYGILKIQDPLVFDLICSAPFQRLKEVHQYGVVHFIQPTEPYSRFDHSIGVYWLLKKAGVSREEQIAGLLHDVSHTVFSHVGDYVFQDTNGAGSYQDDIHIWFLKESGLNEILQKHGLSAERIYHRNPEFTALDQPLPNLCADRLEYNIQGGLLRGLIAKEDFDLIVEKIVFENGAWVINNLQLARKLGACSLIMTETLWGAAWEALAYRFTADALRKAFEIGIVTFDEFHFSTDSLVWNKLAASTDERIAERVHLMQNIHDIFYLTELGQEDLLIRLKFRGVDPLVLHEGQIMPLTQASPEYYTEYQRVKEVMARGWPVKFQTKIDINSQ